MFMSGGFLKFIIPFICPSQHLLYFHVPGTRKEAKARVTDAGIWCVQVCAHVVTGGSERCSGEED